MYLGAILVFVGGPLVTGARSALVVGAALSLLLAVRIVAEETLLVRELPGYDAYRHRVRFRLIPVCLVASGFSRIPFLWRPASAGSLCSVRLQPNPASAASFAACVSR